MNITYHDILIKILDLIDYPDDKEAYVTNFFATIQLNAFATLMDTLSLEKQKELSEKLSQEKDDQTRMTAVINEYFSHEEVMKTFEKETINEITGLLASIQPRLSTEQKESLENMMSQIFPQV